MSSRVATAAALALLAACATPPALPGPPAVAADLRYFAGSALSGRRPEPDADDHLTEARSLKVSCRFDFVPAAPAQSGGEVLAPHTAMILAGGVQQPLLGVSRLTAGARFGHGEPAAVDGSLSLGQRDAALPVGVTAAFFLRDVGSVVRPGPTENSLGIFVAHRKSADLDLALILRPPDTPLIQGGGELVELTVPLQAGAAPVWFAVPSPFADGTSIVLRISAEVPAADDAAHRIALAHCLDELRIAGEQERRVIAPLTPDEAFAHTIDAGIKRIAAPFDLRRSVVFVAEVAGASMLVDLGLACDDEVLKELSGQIESLAGADADLRADPAALRFLLDGLAWRALTERLDSGSIDDALTGFLLHAAGEAGRFPGAITAILARAKSSEDIEAGLIEENRNFLLATSPSSRVRAFDWLAARSLAPSGYDPLGPSEDRKAALAADEERRQSGGETSK